MSHLEAHRVAFKVRQAVGSMAIEGIQVSPESEAMMLQVAAGQMSGKAIRQQLVEKYRRASLT